jgi:hypothetical protein
MVAEAVPATSNTHITVNNAFMMDLIVLSLRWSNGSALATSPLPMLKFPFPFSASCFSVLKTGEREKEFP